MNKKVLAVVVTYRRPNVLFKCLKAVLINSTRKVDELHVVINSGDSETIEVIKSLLPLSSTKISHEIFDNIGPAGGFHFGLLRFLKSDCDYVWLMDDDIIPENNCLESLLYCSNDHPYIFAKVLKPSGEEVQAFGWWGVLISKSIVETVGLPLKEFFYWIEDTEYLQNRMIRKFKIIPFRCKEAVVVHLHDRSGARPSWHYYYTPRNTIYYRLNLFALNNKGRWILIKMTFGLIYRIIFKEPQKKEKMKLFIKGFYHGLNGKLGKVDYLHQSEPNTCNAKN